MSERERESVCVCLRVNGKESVYSREHENKCTRSVCLRKRDKKNSCVQARENVCVCVCVYESEWQGERVSERVRERDKIKL